MIGWGSVSIYVYKKCHTKIVVEFPSFLKRTVGSSNELSVVLKARGGLSSCSVFSSSSGARGYGRSRDPTCELLVIL